MIQTSNIPRHVAIIMDGNGRWAKRQHLTRTQGHAEGIKRVEEIVAAAQKVGIKVLTLFTFSTENWRRPESEISILMNMLANVLQQKMKNLKDHNVKFQAIGREDNVPGAVLKTFQTAISETKNNTGLIVNMAFNYGSRQEIVDAVKKIAAAVEGGSLSVRDIDETTVSRFLYTKDMPDPDLLIRTSGEKRISNFLLWQLSYAELYFTEKFWPDFTTAEFEKAIADYQKRERRFGDLAQTPRGQQG